MAGINVTPNVWVASLHTTEAPGPQKLPIHTQARKPTDPTGLLLRKLPEDRHDLLYEVLVVIRTAQTTGDAGERRVRGCFIRR
jgi:hypothetical protein